MIAAPRPSIRWSTMPTLDLDRFDVLTFDCYGTLIDWESGLLAALREPLAARGVDAPDDALLEAFARHETEVEAGPYLPYRQVLGRVLTSMLGHRGAEPTPEEVASFGGSVADWPAFPDSPAALARLHERFRLGVITNCDDDLFAASNRRLGIDFDWVVTAQQVGSYKPAERNFRVAFERLGLPRERILHVAQSLFHDHAPAQRLGLSSVWIDRRHDRDGAGATPPSDATPDATFPDMASFAEAATRGG
jgi:2-haloacid dehalogenase